MNRKHRSIFRNRFFSLTAILLAAIFLLSARGEKQEESATDDSKPAENAVALHGSSKVGQALDQTFETGKVVFTESAMIHPDPETCEIVMPPDSFWETYEVNNPGVDALRSALAADGLTIWSYAPDGSCAIGYLSGLPVIVTNEKVTVMYPAENRGVEDPHGSMRAHCRQLFESTVTNLRGMSRKVKGSFYENQNGFTWSQGSSYFSVLPDRVRSSYKAPVLTDTRTGEMFCLDSYDPFSSSEFHGTWSAERFSPDERYFYAIEKREKADPNLVRYDLNTLKKETFGDLEALRQAWDILPALYAAPDGSVTFFNNVRDADHVPFYQAIRINADGTSRQQEPFFRSAELSNFYPHIIAGSEVSGETMLLFRDELYTDFVYPDWYYYLFHTALMHVQLNDPEKEANTAWVVRSGSYTLEAVSLSDAESFMKTYETPEAYYAACAGYMDICNMVMSPDGKYAAVLAGGVSSASQEIALIIIRLSDMKTLTVESDILNQIPGHDLSLYSRPLSLNWTEAGLMFQPLQRIDQVQP